MPSNESKKKPHTLGVDYIANSIKSDHQLQVLVEDAVDWAHCNGLVLRTPEHKDRSDVCQTAPFALLPSPFPRSLFDKAMGVQEAMNELYFRVSRDHNFLIHSHVDVVRTDEFTRHMVDILKFIQEEGIHQKITLLTQRADYMCHQSGDEDGGDLEIKQIEVNNIAVSMGGLAQRATLLHRRMLNKILGVGDWSHHVPDNRPISTLARGLYAAWQKFADPAAVVLIVVEDTNQNQLDQKFVEYELEAMSQGRVGIIRLTFTQCAERLSLSPTGDFSLLISDSTTKVDRKVALVYFRSGYSPQNYPTEVEWGARLMMERSTAVKCPWIGLQLANTKKVQQVLTGEGVVERYFPVRAGFDADQQRELVGKVRETFAGLWGLEYDDEETRRVTAHAIEHPEQYVLKPQLEGGGGNFYGEEISTHLTQFSPEKKAAHILMQKIRPLVVRNHLIRAFQPPTLVNAVSELGVYGCLLADREEILENFAHGHILRSKAEFVNEGGVAVGAAVIDTPYLF